MEMSLLCRSRFGNGGRGFLVFWGAGVPYDYGERRVIRTLQKRIHWWAVVLLTSTTSVGVMVEALSAAPLTFTIRKFTADPALISFIGSINLAFSFLVAPYVSWKSDRIWTRWGRRKPFLIGGWSILILALLACPMAPSLWLLILCVAVWQVSHDAGYGAVWSPLLYEMVPMSQRGRAVVIKRCMSTGALVAFNAILLARFDEIYRLRFPFAPGEWVITGEQMIYWVTAGLVFLSVLNIGCLVAETKGKEIRTETQENPFVFVRSLLWNRQWLMIYALVFCSVSLSASLGQLAPLLVTEQFGYSKKVFADLQTWQLLTIVFGALPIAGWLADRVDRFRVFQAGLILSTAHSLIFWAWLEWGTGPGQPWLWLLFFFFLSNALIDTVAGLAIEPYYYDLTPPDKMGSMNAGFLIVSNFLRMLLMMGVGLWVKLFSGGSSEPGEIRYSSGYLFVFLVGLGGIGLSLLFARERARGRIREYGLPS